MTEPATPYIKAFDEQYLTAFYGKMTKAIRSVTDRGIMMQENCYFSNMGVPCHLSPIEKEGQQEPLQAFSPHGYDLVIDTPHVVRGSNNRITTIFNRHYELQQSMNVPVLVGEWGGHDKYREGLEHIQYILSYFDKHKWSHTYWCYYDGYEAAPVIQVLRRPYPQAVAGDIIQYGYDTTADTFILAWHETVEESTEIYLPSEPVSITIDGDYVMHPVSSLSQAVIIKIFYKGNGKRQVKIKL